MIKLENFSDVNDALAYLRSRQYRQSFTCKGKGWFCEETNTCFYPEELIIDASCRFSLCNGKPSMAVLYAVQTPKGTKGVILDNCHTYANPKYSEYLVRMKLHQLIPYKKAS